VKLCKNRAKFGAIGSLLYKFSSPSESPEYNRVCTNGRSPVMMFQYIIRRIITSIPVLIGILFVTFSLARLIPGDPCRAILGEKATEKICERFIQEKGLDKPVLTQFAI
jgi:hypothetical protein